MADNQQVVTSMSDEERERRSQIMQQARQTCERLAHTTEQARIVEVELTDIKHLTSDELEHIARECEQIKLESTLFAKQQGVQEASEEACIRDQRAAEPESVAQAVEAEQPVVWWQWVDQRIAAAIKAEREQMEANVMESVGDFVAQTVSEVQKTLDQLREVLAAEQRGKVLDMPNPLQRRMN
jgi:hypothetical protein